MKEQLVETTTLGNGLTLEIMDLSRRLAGDRWLVSVEARMDIPLKMEHLEGISHEQEIFNELKKTYKESVPYRYRKERHFIDQEEKGKVLEQMVGNMKKTLIPYLSRSDFPAKFILSSYAKLKDPNQRRFL